MRAAQLGIPPTKKDFAAKFEIPRRVQFPLALRCVQCGARYYVPWREAQCLCQCHSSAGKKVQTGRLQPAANSHSIPVPGYLNAPCANPPHSSAHGPPLHAHMTYVSPRTDASQLIGGSDIFCAPPIQCESLIFHRDSPPPPGLVRKAWWGSTPSGRWEAWVKPPTTAPCKKKLFFLRHRRRKTRRPPEIRDGLLGVVWTAHAPGYGWG